MSVQTTIPFNIRKKCFYGASSKCQAPKLPEKELPATLATTTTPNVTRDSTTGRFKYVPTVKKIVSFSSSDSEDSSDVENLESANKDVGFSSPRRRKPENHGSKSKDSLCCSPPKQRRSEPSTALTPSTLLSRVNLHEESDSREPPLSPRKLFATEKYRNARKALHSSRTDNLPGREDELRQLREFINEHLESGTSASLYVSGPPGTGKTASLAKVTSQPEFASKFRNVYVNCTSMKSATAIYGKILEGLGLEQSGKVTGRNWKQYIEKQLDNLGSKKWLLLVLDEIDQLESRNQSVLYTIFEWPRRLRCRLLLVGIANALDLTDRILPRLQARCELKPKLMHFAPYSKAQIYNIIYDRLERADVSDVFTTTAMQLLAGKVAAVSGDVRRALDIARRVIELAEARKSAQILQPCEENPAESADKEGKSKPSTATSDKPVAADLKEVMTVLNGVYGGTQCNVDKDDGRFPLQQKLLLCSLVLILNHARNKDVTVGRLYDVYKRVCTKRNIYAVDISEFVGLCSLIETQGVIRMFGKKEPKLSKIGLQWDQEELGKALRDKNLMAEVINDVSCL